MANTSDKNPPSTGPKKVAAPANPRLAEAQKRAAALAGGAGKSGKQPTSPATFFQEAWVELKKTTWPTKDVLAKSTYVVLALVVSVAVWVGAIDYILGKVLNPLFGTH